MAQFVHLQMSDQIRHGILAPQGFKIHEVDGGRQRALAAVAAEPPLGPLVNFIGNWTGLDFNTIFRPSKQAVSAATMCWN